MQKAVSLVMFLRITLSALALNAVMSACAHIGHSGTDAWKEEVQLHDGQKMIVERSQTYGGRREIGQSPPVREHKISFALPGSSNSISWTSEYGEDLGRTNFKLAALHVLGGTPYLVAVPNLCLAYNKWGRPNPPYVIFKHEDKEWKRIALNDLPTEFKEFNLVINNQGEAETVTSQPMVTAQIVKKLNGELMQPEYKAILREPLPKGGSGTTSCEELVRYKCGWGSPDEINRKYFERICK